VKIGIAYNNNSNNLWLNIQVDENATVIEAIRQSGILQKYPEINIEINKLGIFGKMVKANQILTEGDRIEIYRPITADPLTVHRRDNDDGDDDEDD
jgi:hypothetical protein